MKGLWNIWPCESQPHNQFGCTSLPLLQRITLLVSPDTTIMPTCVKCGFITEVGTMHKIILFDSFWEAWHIVRLSAASSASFLCTSWIWYANVCNLNLIIFHTVLCCSSLLVDKEWLRVMASSTQCPVFGSYGWTLDVSIWKNYQLAWISYPRCWELI